MVNPGDPAVRRSVVSCQLAMSNYIHDHQDLWGKRRDHLDIVLHSPFQYGGHPTHDYYEVTTAQSDNTLSASSYYLAPSLREWIPYSLHISLGHDLCSHSNRSTTKITIRTPTKIISITGISQVHLVSPHDMHIVHLGYLVQGVVSPLLNQLRGYLHHACAYEFLYSPCPSGLGNWCLFDTVYDCPVERFAQ